MVPTLRARYREAGLRRGRTLIVAEVADEPLAYALVDDITPGLFWAEFLNAFSVHVPTPAHPQAGPARTAVILAALENARQRGRKIAECLATEEDAPALRELGFTNLGRVVEWTVHRTLARDWNNHLIAVFERLSQGEDASTELRAETEMRA